MVIYKFKEKNKPSFKKVQFSRSFCQLYTYSYSFYIKNGWLYAMTQIIYSVQNIYRRVSEIILWWAFWPCVGACGCVTVSCLIGTVLDSIWTPDGSSHARALRAAAERENVLFYYIGQLRTAVLRLVYWRRVVG